MLVVADNGIGMNRQELIDNLGTIARSGTEAFVKQMAESQAGDGAGRAERAGRSRTAWPPGSSANSASASTRPSWWRSASTSVTRRADEAEGWRWRSDGTGSFSIAHRKRMPPAAPGSSSTCARTPREFLEPLRIRTVVKAYSDHVGLPIWLENESGQKEMVNEGSALWSRPRSDIEEDQYREFYHHIAHMPGDPWHTIHLHAEGSDRVHGAALRARLHALRSVRPDPPAPGPALRQAGLHHRRVRGADPALPPLHAGRGGFRRPRAQRQPRDAAERPDSGEDQDRPGQARLLRAGEARRRRPPRNTRRFGTISARS